MIVCSFDVKTLSKYDILVLVSNRLYLVLVIGLYTRYGYRNLFTSKGDGNLVPQTRGSPICLSIDTYLPREGPETRQTPCKLFHKQVWPPIYLARGRKPDCYESFHSVTSSKVKNPIYFARGRRHITMRAIFHLDFSV